VREHRLPQNRLQANSQRRQSRNLRRRSLRKRHLPSPGPKRRLLLQNRLNQRRQNQRWSRSHKLSLLLAAGKSAGCVFFPLLKATADVMQVKMNRMRLRIAERLKQSQNTAASLTTFNEVDMSSLTEFRKLYKDDILKKTGVKLGFVSAFSRACVLAMKEKPIVNASIEGPGGGPSCTATMWISASRLRLRKD
jgi:pyruvate/2-oxoglutarate dehydrogenase complex dihydrolipoamide acyltransferase (E2) component